jgi:protein TonB
MAFEAFLERDDVRPRRRRRVTYTVSLIVHAALLGVGIAYSFWRVDEISPPTVRVTFMSSAPPPAAPPPPAAGGGSAAPRKKILPKVKPTLATLVQPRLIPPKRETDEPKTEPPDDDDPDQAFAGGTRGGTKGGTIGGTIGGTLGGTPGGTIGGGAGGTPGPRSTPPRMVAPNMGAKQKASGDDPEFPAILRRAGTLYVVLAKVCVSRTGTVDGVSILKGAHPMLDAKVIAAVKAWRYRPLLADSNAVPFCYPLRFEFNSD